MTLEPSQIRRPTPFEWDSIWEGCDEATFFHSRHWAELWERYSQGRTRADPCIVSFDDGRQALVPLSVSQRYRGLLSVWESSPAGTFGGWISTDNLSPGDARELTEHMLHYPNLEWISNPYDPSAVEAAPHDGCDCSTWSIDLRIGFEELYRILNKARVPNKVRQAQRQGLVLKQLKTDDDVAAMFALYQECQTRWAQTATNHYSKDMLQLLRNCGFCDLWGAVMPDGQLASAGVFLRSKRHVAAWMAMAKTELLPVRPYDFLFYSLIERYQREGYWWFDFNPSGGHAGVDEFKRRFGAEAHPCPVIRQENAWGRLLRTSREQVVAHRFGPDDKASNEAAAA